MFVVLITSIANAQTTFDFECDAPTVQSELAEIYSANTFPTGYASGSLVESAALAVDHLGTAGAIPRTNFIKSLAYFNVTVNSIFDDYPTVANLSNGNAVPNIGTNDGLNNMNPAQFSVFAFEVIKAFYRIGHPDVADPSTLEGAIEAMYAANTHPETLADIINTAAGVAYDNRSDNASDPRLAFIAKLNKFGVVFEGFNNNGGNRYVTFVNNTIDPIQSPVDGVNVTTAQFQEWMLRIARNIWLYEHQDYIYEQREIDRIAEILAIDTVDGLSIQHTKLVQGSITNHQFFISNGDTANISEVSISGVVLNAYNDANFITKKAEVQTAYGVQSSNLTEKN